jgi:peptidoglycan LD-endopeptidase LytH
MKLRSTIIGVTASLLMFAGTAQGASYTVQSGDTLWKVSVKYNTTIADLVQRNRLTSLDVIHVGQVLNVPGPTAYIVNNDTMWQISQKFGVTLDALIKANPQIADPNNIWNGMTVYIPETAASAPVTSLQPAVTSQPAPAPAPAPAHVVQQPIAFANGMFPLAKGTYLPMVNTYNDGRSWTTSGDAARKHEGVDIMAPKGTAVYSVLDGQIINFGWNEYGGWRVTVRVDGSTVFYYAHLSKYAPGLGKGSQVKKGQLLGYVGNTGYGPEGTEGKFDPHLHFGIYKTDQATWYTIDPFPFLQKWGSNP